MAPVRLGIGGTGVQAGQARFQDPGKKARGVAIRLADGAEIGGAAGGGFRIETGVAARNGLRAVAGRA